MSEVKHTPGPWEVETDPWHYDTASTVVGGEKIKAKGLSYQMIVQVGGWASPTEQEANARLIAAAPELLGALQGVLWARENGVSEALAEAYARVAIAKATTGGTDHHDA